MDFISKRRVVRTAALALLVGAASASPAAAQPPCTAPAEPGWHSCLTTAHRTIGDGPELRLTKARPRLVVRGDRCPARAERRTVTIRVDGGRRLARERVRGTCRRGVARWIVDLTLDVDLRDGTVVRSYWSGIRDADGAPSVKLKASA
jgi:hypothetical protein